MKKITFLDILFWLFLIIALGYVIGKLTGLIGTPEWVELLPIISIIFAAGIAYQRMIFFTRSAEKRTDYLKTHLDKIEQKQIDTDKKIYSLEQGQNLILGLLKKSN